MLGSAVLEIVMHMQGINDLLSRQLPALLTDNKYNAQYRKDGQSPASSEGCAVSPSGLAFTFSSFFFFSPIRLESLPEYSGPLGGRCVCEASDIFCPLEVFAARSWDKWPEGKCWRVRRFSVYVSL